MQVLKKIGFPIAVIYGLVVRLRNYLFDVGVYSSKSFKTPTICVGNISAGGTGKTPMIEYLVRLLKHTHKVAVLSRGYGRKSKGLYLAKKNSTVEELGDEPFQVYSKFSDISLVVSSNRREGISFLEKEIAPDIILLDDAYQHRKVTPSISILLTAYNNLYCDDWFLPVGSLRDTKQEAKRANLIVVTKCPDNLEEEKRSQIIKRLKVTSSQEVVFSTLCYDVELKGGMQGLTLDDVRQKKITLVTGIAYPEPLVAYLKSEKISFEHLKYKDHHFFSTKEINLFSTKECILTTEKDYVRLKGKLNKLWYIEMKHKFLFQGEEKLKIIIATPKISAS
ncbi:MAG: tetraacyldisaccharide 4'-kinase [Cellulophaga sp.]